MSTHAVMVATGVLGSVGASRGALAGLRRGRVRRRLTHRRDERPPRSFHRLEAVLDRCAMAIVPEQAVVGAVAITGAAITGGLVVGGPGLAVVMAVGLFGGAVVTYAIRRNRRDERIEAELPEVLEGLARSLRSGHSLRQSLSAHDAARGTAAERDLAQVAAMLAAGASVAGALSRWAQRRPLPGVQLTVSALVLATEAGGAQAQAIDGVASTLRGRLELRREVQALASQASTSGVVVAMLPLVFLALTVSADRATATFLFSTPLGLGCLVVGLALDATAAWWMHHIARAIR